MLPRWRHFAKVALVAGSIVGCLGLPFPGLDVAVPRSAGATSTLKKLKKKLRQKSAKAANTVAKLATEGAGILGKAVGVGAGGVLGAVLSSRDEDDDCSPNVENSRVPARHSKSEPTHAASQKQAHIEATPPSRK
jgi:hypothetical protein